MTQPQPARHRPACGFVDNASALPTTPQAHHQQERRTFDPSYPADIFTRHGQQSSATWPAHRLQNSSERCDLIDIDEAFEITTLGRIVSRARWDAAHADEQYYGSKSRSNAQAAAARARCATWSSMEAEVRGILRTTLKEPEQPPEPNLYERIRARFEPLGGIDLEPPPRARVQGAHMVTRDSGGFEGCGLTLINPWQPP